MTIDPNIMTIEPKIMMIEPNIIDDWFKTTGPMDYKMVIKEHFTKNLDHMLNEWTVPLIRVGLRPQQNGFCYVI